MPTKILSIAFLIAFLLGCSEKSREEIVNGFKETYDESFKKTFRSSFITSCVDGEDVETKQRFCECVVDDLLSKFSTEELTDAEKIKKYVEEYAIAACSEKIE